MRDPHDLAPRADRYWEHRNGPENGGGLTPYPPVDELQDMTAPSAGEHVSLNQMLRTAEDSLQKAKTFTQRGQLDLALDEYLRASEITINGIPSHHDFTYMNRQHPRWSDRFSALLMGVNSQHGTMEAIKQKIAASNNVATSRSRPSSRIELRSSSPKQSHNSQTPAYFRNSMTMELPLRMPSPSNFQTSSPGSPKFPTHQPSSPRFHSDDSLTQRFAQLRNARHERTSALYGRSAAGEHSPPASNANCSLAHSRQQSSVQYHPSHNVDIPSTRPSGPRPMYSSHNSAPILPPKVPLDPLNATLPRYPSPAYSPTRTVPSQPPPNPPRASVDSTRSSLYKQNSSWIGTPNGYLSGHETPYRSQTPDRVQAERESRAPPPYLPLGPTITAQQLVECLRKSEVLLIDVRPRTEFDSGHILAKSVMCIEPVILREGVSAEDLEERLVVSPESESTLFSRRDEFDLIVYYDWNTREPSYLVGSPVGTIKPHLRALYDTLYEFNLYKPLKGGRQPTLLVGGLEAWIDLLGPQSLGTSHTAAVMSAIRDRKPIQKPAQMVRRVPTVASANSSWEVKKRRLRAYRPLDKDEERVWMEKAKNEEIDPGTYGSFTEEPDRIDEHPHQEPESPFARTYEDFLRRFPDPCEIRESMVTPATREPMPSSHDSSIMAPPSRPPPAVPRRSYGGVSDGRQIQPPLARQNGATKHPLYAAASPLDRLKLPRTGLVNLGMTCYMNSIIQSLSATKQLTAFFMDNRFHAQVQKNWKGSQGVLPGLYSNLVRSLWKGDVEVIRPTSFRKFIGRLNSEWAGSEQQDAKEFFDVLIDCLHEDLNIHWMKKPTEPLTFEQEMRRERMPIHRVCDIEWDRYCHRELSYISTLFAGQHASRLRCTTCRNTSTTYEAFFSISVEIPTSGPGDIYQCLRSYTQEEMLSDDDVWKCPHCRREREATKQIILTRAPRFLVIHFKRFSASRNQQARKIHTPVNFPLTGFDLTPFMIPPAKQRPQSSGEGHNAPSHPPPQSTLSAKELATSPPYLYNAYAVVRHLGSTIHEGHYISVVRDNIRDCWRKFDDQRVTDFRPGGPNSRDNLANEQAYLVFYERVMVN